MTAPGIAQPGIDQPGIAQAKHASLVRRIRRSLPEGRPLPEEVWQRRHLGITILLWLHAVGMVIFALFMGNSLEHSLIEGGMIAAPAVVGSIKKFGRRMRSAVTCLGLITASGVLVHLSGGYIEMHFHFFVMVVVIALYQDWVPFLLTIGYVVVHHGMLGLIVPDAVFNHPDAQAQPLKWAIIHAVFVLGASVASVVNWRLNESARARQELLLRSAGEGLCGIDESGRITFVNPAAVRILGWRERDLVGRSLDTLLPPEVSDEQECGNVQESFARALEEHVDQQQSTTVFLRKDGTLFPAEYLCMPMQERGEVIGVVMTFQDISERKRAEAELQEAKAMAESANLAKSQFLSRMSHELRTPLNAVLGYAQILAMNDLTAQQQKAVSNIFKGGNHLLDLINEVLDIARIEERRLSLSLEPVHIQTLIREVVEVVEPLADQRKIALFDNTASLDDLYVMADYQRCKQVLLNMLSNAIKYNREEGSVTLSYEQTGHHQLRIRVSDTGAGIADEEQSMLFTPFTRLGSQQSSIEGVGLGLALSKHLVEAMGGTIGVESSLGQGSTFWFMLPLTEAVQQGVKPEESPAAVLVDQSHHTTLLYIEDNQSNITLVEELLALRTNINLITATQGSQGLAYAREHQPDLILLDVHLPDIMGDEVLRLLRSDARTKDIPVVVLSADATKGQIKRLMDRGAQSYLTKPIDVKQFFQVLEKTLPQPAQQEIQAATRIG